MPEENARNFIKILLARYECAGRYVRESMYVCVWCSCLDIIWAAAQMKLSPMCIMYIKPTLQTTSNHILKEPQFKACPSHSY